MCVPDVGHRKRFLANLQITEENPQTVGERADMFAVATAVQPVHPAHDPALPGQLVPKRHDLGCSLRAGAEL